ncbi:polymorphic toxin type 50 domain-containing protein [Pseudomonas sp. MLB6B]
MIGGEELLNGVLMGVVPLGKRSHDQKSVSVDKSKKAQESESTSKSGNPEVKWSAQEKPFPGHNSYTESRNVLTSDPRQLAKHASSGQQLGKIPAGEPGSKERVNFGESIGYFLDERGVSAPTTNGIIHYSKDGIHIVTARP